MPVLKRFAGIIIELKEEIFDDESFRCVAAMHILQKLTFRVSSLS